MSEKKRSLITSMLYSKICYPYLYLLFKLSYYRAINNKTPLVVEIIRDMRILRRKFENNKSRKIFETKI